MDQKKTTFYDPLPYGYAFKTPRVMGAISYCCSVAEARDAVEHDTRNDYDWRAVCEYMDHYGIIPDWLETRMAEAARHAKPWHKYVVTHLGTEHLVVARIVAEAATLVWTVGKPPKKVTDAIASLTRLGGAER